MRRPSDRRRRQGAASSAVETLSAVQFEPQSEYSEYDTDAPAQLDGMAAFLRKQLELLALRVACSRSYSSSQSILRMARDSQAEGSTIDETRVAASTSSSRITKKSARESVTGEVKAKSRGVMRS